MRSSNNWMNWPVNWVSIWKKIIKIKNIIYILIKTMIWIVKWIDWYNFELNYKNIKKNKNQFRVKFGQIKF